jgi:hypothetical protein
MKGVITLLDVYGDAFSFTTFNQTKFKTFFGGLMSLVTLGLIIMFSFLFGSDFYYRRNPKVILQTIDPEYYELTPVSNSNFTIMWRMEDGMGYPVDFTGKVYPTFQYKERSKDENGALVPNRIIDFEYTKCSNISDVNEFAARKYNLSQWFCLDLDKYKNISLGGYWDGDFMNNLAFRINFCSGDGVISPENKCSNYTQLDTFFQMEGSYFVFQYPTSYFMASSFEKPLQTLYKTYSVPLSCGLFTQEEFHFGRVELQDDKGWMIATAQPNITTASFYSKNTGYTWYSPESMFMEGSYSNVYGLTIYMDKSFNYYYRSYMKIQDLFAILGGAISAIMIVMRIICGIVNIIIRQDYLFNSLFEYKPGEKG